MPREQRFITAQVDVDADFRTETLLGVEYTVVPCVAMVEGVRFGANQDSPELGLASEFGNLPVSWANRPLVLNHPMVDDEFVSANIPEVLESWQFGLTMNPVLEGNKLKMEAWINPQRVEELGGDFQETFDRILAKEAVEVSVGFFSDIEPKKGRFNGQSYSAIWRNIKPDHLAILSNGVIGACSNKDGCGIPRINQKGETMAKLQVDTNKDPTTQSCSCGGSHDAGTEGNEDAPVTQKGLAKIISDLIKPLTQSEEDRVTEAHKTQRARNHQLLAQTINSDLMNSDIQKILSQAGAAKFPKYAYLYGYTQDVAVFERYDDKAGKYQLFQIGFNVNGAKVEFVGEPEEVILQTKIVPTDKVKLTTEQENDMTTPTDPKTQEQTPAPAATTTTPVVTQEQKPAPKVLTAQEYIDQAPSEIKEVLQASMNVHQQRKDVAIKTLKDHPNNKFTEDYLKAQTLEVLENMAALLPGSFKGIAPANNPHVQGSNSQETVPAPKAFTRKDPNAKAA